jgi:hypothetical protein
MSISITDLAKPKLKQIPELGWQPGSCFTEIHARSLINLPLSEGKRLQPGTQVMVVLRSQNRQIFQIMQASGLSAVARHELWDGKQNTWHKSSQIFPILKNDLVRGASVYAPKLLPLAGKVADQKLYYVGPSPDLYDGVSTMHQVLTKDRRVLDIDAKDIFWLCKDKK